MAETPVTEKSAQVSRLSMESTYIEVPAGAPAVITRGGYKAPPSVGRVIVSVPATDTAFDVTVILYGRTDMPPAFNVCVAEKETRSVSIRIGSVPREFAI